jgi:hypothetical protein
MAAIAQGSLADTHEVRDPADTGPSYELCGRWRDAAGGLNAAVHAGNLDQAKAALTSIQKCCQDCHARFRKE